MIQNTPRKGMSQKRRHHIFTENSTAHNVAPCCVCGEPIHRHDDDWQIEHMRALALLGKDTNTNCAPAHTACAREKTHRQDLPAIRKAKRLASPKKRKGVWKSENTTYDWKRQRYMIIPG